MRQCLLVLILSIPALLPAPIAAAREYTELYEFRTPLASRSEAEMNRAMRQGLEEVLGRITPGDLRQPLVVDALERAPQFVVQSRFEAVDRAAAALPGEDLAETRLVLRYSAGLIQDLLRDAGLPMWGTTRPPVLVLLQTPVDEGDRILEEGSLHPVAQALRAAAERAGLPLQWPLMDLQDQLRLPAGKMRMLDEAALRATAQRYGLDHWLAGVLARTETGWRANWRSNLAGQSSTWQSSGEALAQLAADGIDAVVVPLQARYSVELAVAERASVLLTLTDIESLQAYVTALRVLDQVTGVRAVELDGLRGATAVFRVYLEGETQQFREQLALNERLLETTAPVEDSSSTLRVYYRFLY